MLMADHETRELVASAQRGDRAAFGQLVEQRRDQLYNVILRIVGSREEAEDMVQMAFLQAFVELPKFRGESAFFTWLYRIAVNAGLYAARRKRPMVSLDERRGISDRWISSDHGPEESLERDERARIVRAGLESLAPDLRATLVLREFETCNYEEIAITLDISIGCVRSRLHRARAQLRKYILERSSLNHEAN
jgi:RNA polymerase sigma-70 factor (ECF subfamily)